MSLIPEVRRFGVEASNESYIYRQRMGNDLEGCHGRSFDVERCVFVYRNWAVGDEPVYRYGIGTWHLGHIYTDTGVVFHQQHLWIMLAHGKHRKTSKPNLSVAEKK